MLSFDLRPFASLVLAKTYTVTAIGMGSLLVMVSAIILSGYQPSMASPGDINLPNQQQVLGMRIYEMQVVHQAKVLDLAVTPFDFDEVSAKWNYKVSWNRKSGSVGNIYINGNLFVSGAKGINEAYTGYSLEPGNSYTLSYTYLARSGRKTLQKQVYRGKFSVLSAESSEVYVPTQQNNATTNDTSSKNVPLEVRGSLEMSLPTASSTVTGDDILQVKVTGTSTHSFTGEYTLSIDSRVISTGKGELSSDAKNITINSEVKNLRSIYFRDITPGVHTLSVVAKLFDQKTLSAQKTFIYVDGATAIQVPVSVNRSYFEDINADGVLDYKDSLLLGSVLSQPTLCPSPNTCDVDGNGDLTLGDWVDYRIFLNSRYDMNGDGDITSADYELMGDVVAGTRGCPTSTCDYASGGGVNMDDWAKFLVIAKTFPNY